VGKAKGREGSEEVIPVFDSRAPGAPYQVTSDYEYLEKFKNCAARPKDEFILRLLIRPPWKDVPEAVSEMISAVPSSGAAKEVNFIFDTGSNVTILSRKTALEAGIETKGIERPTKRVRLLLGEHVLFIVSEVEIQLGLRWVPFTCYVPADPRYDEDPKDILGMSGLLNDHLMCLNQWELHLFRELPRGLYSRIRFPG
jgi:hypothetical protein